MVAHSEIFLSKCAQFREQGEFIDVRLKVGEDEFPAHRIVLAANSDYFHAMFANGMKESNQEVIELKDKNISNSAFKIVMDSMYSGEINVNDENVFEVLLAADHLQVSSVVQQCCEYLIQLNFDVQTFCRVITSADRHGLKDLKEVMESKLALMYKEICEKEEFCSDMSADVLSALLCRDDLSAPSENFVFKSVIQWIKYRKEERMDVAGKVIGAVRLGLVDISVVIEELDTEEMQVIPEVNMLLQRTLIYNQKPSSSSAFALEKGKPRSMSSVLVAIHPKSDICYFDIQSKTWKQLSSMQQLSEAKECYCAELIGNNLYVAAKGFRGVVIYCYDTVRNIWSTLPIPGLSDNQIDCLCHVEEHLYVIYKNSSAPHRYNIATNQWESVAGWKPVCDLKGQEIFVLVEAAVQYKSCLYVLYAQGIRESLKICPPGIDEAIVWGKKCRPCNSVLFCFDPKKNVWEQKASTKTPHFGSSLLVVNKNLYVAGGRCSFDLSSNKPDGSPAAIEVYNDQKNVWSVVPQTCIPPNNLGAEEIEGKVYFIINSFPVDSGITTPPGEVYPAVLNDWKNLGNVDKNVVLCSVPVKTENLERKKKQCSGRAEKLRHQ